MTILPLVIAPDPRLSICSEEVEEVTDELRRLMDDMIETMHHENGIGLAAVQVGIHKRILVMEIPEVNEKEEPIELKRYYMVNPVITDHSEEENIYEEGCLSFPDQMALVSRPKKVTIEYLDYNGEKQVVKCDELLSTCVQHEIDHLNGVVFIDHISKMRRDMIMQKLKKRKKMMQRQGLS